ncbi:MAG: hypothetical protein Kapaf2KO_09900 [Candidatus Kapaibacteriales bacterium]
MDEIFLKIIDKHLGEKLFALYVMSGRVKCRHGRLDETFSSKYRLFDVRANQEVVINYFKDVDNYTIALYNYHCVDLTQGKTPMSLGAKLGLSTLKSDIISKLKENISRVVSVCIFENGTFMLREGILDNIGMKDAIIKAGRFRDQELRIAFSSIIHIFDEDCTDIIAA